MSESPSSVTTNPAAPSVWRGWAVVFVAACGLYAATASRGVQWQDPGEHILRIVSGQLIHRLGLALSHPLHYWLGRLAARAPGVEPALAITLVSAMAAAAAVANVYACVVLLTGRRAAAAWSAGSLAVAATFWQWATLAETYAICAALLAAECWLIVRYAQTERGGLLLILALVNGLGVANHLMALLTTPILAALCLLALWRRHLWWAQLAAAVGLWVLGSLPYTGLILHEVLRSGQPVATIRSALFGAHYAEAVFNTSVALGPLAMTLAFVGYNFPNLLLPAAAVGIARGPALSVPRVARRALLAALGVHLVFVLRYSVVDQHTFLVPSYVLLAIFGGLGYRAAAHWRAPRRRATLVLAWAMLGATPVVYAVAPMIARRVGLLDGVVRHKPYRDDYRYFMVPWSFAERSAARMASEALGLAGPDGLIVAEDRMGTFALEYQRLRAGWDSLQIVRDPDADAIVGAARKGRPVVLVPTNVDRINTPAPVGRWCRIGDLYVLEAGTPTPTHHGP